jgi:hypothetical protein
MGFLVFVRPDVRPAKADCSVGDKPTRVKVRNLYSSKRSVTRVQYVEAARQTFLIPLEPYEQDGPLR